MGLGHIIGGALAGLGQGIVTKAANDVQARRDAALAEARRQEQAEGNQQMAEREALGDQRRFSNASALQDDAQESAFKMGAAGAEAKAAAETVAQKRAVALEVVKSKNRINEEAQSKILEMQAKHGDPEQVITDDDGNSTMVFKGGRQVSLGKIGPTAAGKRANSEGPMVDRYAAGSQPVSGAPAATKTVTRAQVAEAAKAKGISVAQAETEARRLGFEIK